MKTKFWGEMTAASARRVIGIPLLTFLGSALSTMSWAAEAMQVRMLLVGPAEPEYTSHRNGAVLGQTEGNIQGRFLGINYVLDEVSVEDALLAGAGISAVVVAAGREQLMSVLEHFAPLHVPVFNITLADMDLREQCFEGLYQTLPSAKMLADAEAQWVQENPGANVSALAWHPEFVKYAGRDLNKRYTEQFSVEMDSAAWAGWAATRIVAEAAVRTGSADPAAIDALLQDGLVFDGQKGLNQTFRNNGQLRQPLLLVDADGELVGEAPVRGVADIDDLDSLGLPGCQQ
jgi:ABC-type branched-subunit amino acid transport system substrate-binding protein